MYELRNYMQHSGLPAVNYEATKEYGERNGRSGYLANMSVGFNREEMLRNSHKWKPKVKKELEDMTGDVPVPPCMFEYVVAVQEVFLGVTDRALYAHTLQAKRVILNSLN